MAVVVDFDPKQMVKRAPPLNQHTQLQIDKATIIIEMMMISFMKIQGKKMTRRT